MKIAVISDTHCGVRASSDIFIEYQRKFYEKVFFPYLEEHGIKKIIHLGDYYDNRASINFKALSANRKMFLEVLRDRGITMDIIPGNHDVVYKNTNSLNSLKELLGHYMDEVNIIEDPTVMDYDGLKIAFIPWINIENEEQIRYFVQTCDADFLAAHLELAGFEMHAGIPSPEGMDPSIFSRFDTVITGHYHTKSRRGNIIYLGSQMEFTWGDCEDRKYFHVIDTETKDITPVENPIKMYVKIRYDDTARNYGTYDVSDLDEKYVKLIVVNKTKHVEFEKFVDRINSRKIHNLQIVENFDDFLGNNVDDDKISVEDTESLLHTYIDATDTKLDKERIKSAVHSLMVEAQDIDID